MREQFEKLPEIAEMIEGSDGDLYFCETEMRYKNGRFFQDSQTGFINGAWYAYQEKQKKIDDLIKTLDWHIEDCGIVEETEYNKAWLEAMLFVKQELLK